MEGMTGNAGTYERSRNPLCVQLDMEFGSDALRGSDCASRNPLCVQLDMELCFPEDEIIELFKVAIRYACN